MFQLISPITKYHHRLRTSFGWYCHSVVVMGPELPDGGKTTNCCTGRRNCCSFARHLVDAFHRERNPVCLKHSECTTTICGYNRRVNTELLHGPLSDSLRALFERINLTFKMECYTMMWVFNPSLVISGEVIS